MGFHHRMETVAFETKGMSRQDFYRYRDKYLPELSMNELIRITGEMVIHHAQGVDDWYGIMYDSLKDILRTVNRATHHPDAENKMLSFSEQMLTRPEAINNLGTVIAPGLIYALEDVVPGFKDEELEVISGRVLGVGALLTWTRKR